jgi:hypothetical protein
MLTGMVNVAVFAAFRFMIGIISHENFEFKRVRGSRQRDSWRYGWQKRQDRGKEVATDGKVGGKSGKDVRWCKCIHMTVPAAEMGSDCHAYLAIALVSHPWRQMACVNRTNIL